LKRQKICLNSTSSKYRRKVLVNGVDERLKAILREVAEETHSELIEFEVMPDHVHVLVEVDPQFGIHSLIKRMKGRSSRLLRQEFPWLKSRLPTLWTNSYFVSTCGEKRSMPLAVRTYVCDSCGMSKDRDWNASLNIRAAGLAVLNACGGA
jgi:putative transposase